MGSHGYYDAASTRSPPSEFSNAGLGGTSESTLSRPGCPALPTWEVKRNQSDRSMALWAQLDGIAHRPWRIPREARVFGNNGRSLRQAGRSARRIPNWNAT